jgi:hypothetical protein
VSDDYDPSGDDHQRQPDLFDRTVGVIGMAVVAGMALFLAPGIVLDWALNRFEHDPKGLFMAALKDGPTWLCSLAFWLVLAVIVVVLYSRRSRRRPAPGENLDPPFDE